MTGRDLVTASLRLIGAIAPGESITGAEASDGLASLNRLIDSWSNESLILYADTIEDFNLVAGTDSYTIGPSGDFNTVRPLAYNFAKLKMTNTTPNTEYPLRIATLEEWTLIRQKGLSSNIPNTVFFDVSYPLDTIRLYPVPSTVNKITLYTSKQLSSISSLDASISLPPGFERALVFNFALEIAPEYGKQPSELILKSATESKASIKRTNHKELHLRVDDALLGGGYYNIYIGDT